MSDRNIIQATFDEFGSSTFGVKKSGSWYYFGEVAIAVVNLQKSQYGREYFVNAGLWLLGDDLTTKFPQPHKCHVQTRLSRLVPVALQGRLVSLLDLGSPIDDTVRRGELLGMLNDFLWGALKVGTTSRGLVDGDGLRLVRASLVTAEGQRLLAS